eukprot:scaffold2636_cov340-Pavlova_lutheri.AAC.57
MVSDTWPERRNHPPSRGGNPRTGASDEAEGNPRDGRKTASETVLRLDLLENPPLDPNEGCPILQVPELLQGRLHLRRRVGAIRRGIERLARRAALQRAHDATASIVGCLSPVETWSWTSKEIGWNPRTKYRQNSGQQWQTKGKDPKRSRTQEKQASASFDGIRKRIRDGKEQGRFQGRMSNCRMMRDDDQE